LLLSKANSAMSKAKFVKAGMDSFSAVKCANEVDRFKRETKRDRCRIERLDRLEAELLRFGCEVVTEPVELSSGNDGEEVAVYFEGTRVLAV